MYYNNYDLLESILVFLYDNPGARRRPTAGGGETCTSDVEVGIVIFGQHYYGVRRPSVAPVGV